MARYYKIETPDGRPLLAVIEQDFDIESPLTWSDPVKDHRPLFVLTNHQRYQLGDKDAEAIGWDLVRSSPEWDRAWTGFEEYDTLEWCDDALLQWVEVPDDQWRQVPRSEGGLRTEVRSLVSPEGPSWREISVDGEEYRWNTKANEEYLEEDLQGLVTAAQRVGATVVPVYMYEHGDICLSLGPFSDPWDSGTLGVILWTKEEQEAYWGHSSEARDPEVEIRARFYTYNEYIQGEVYRVEVLDPAMELDYLRKREGQADLALEDLSIYDLEFIARKADQIMSCGGYYGLSDALDEVKAQCNNAELEEIGV